MTTHDLTAALVEAADALDELAALREDLATVGRVAARELHGRGDTYAEAAWDGMPQGTPIGGPAWAAIERGFRAEWHRLDALRDE